MLPYQSPRQLELNRTDAYNNDVWPWHVDLPDITGADIHDCSDFVILLKSPAD